MGKVYSSADIEDLAASTEASVLVLYPDDVISPSALDLARDRGLTVLWRQEQNAEGIPDQRPATRDDGVARTLISSRRTNQPGSPTPTPGSDPGMPIIDAHVHIGRARWMSSPVSVADLLARMDAAGVTLACTFPFADREPAANDELWDMVRDEPRAVPVALCNPVDPDGYRDLERNLERGFRAVKLHPTVHGYPLDLHAVSDPVFELAARFDVPVLAHCFSDGPFNTAGQFYEMSSRHPDVDLVALHGGFMWHTMGLVEYARRNSNLYIETSSVYPNLLREAARDLPATQFVFGTDTPFSDQQAELAKIEVAFDDEADRRKVLGDNMARLLGTDLTTLVADLRRSP